MGNTFTLTTSLVDMVKAAYNDGCRVFAVRALCEDEAYNVGDWCRDSYDYDGEKDCSTYYTTGESAHGTCGVAVYTFPGYFPEPDDDEPTLMEAFFTAFTAAQDYRGTHYAIIAGDCDVSADYASDEGEARITNAKVLAYLA